MSFSKAEAVDHFHYPVLETELTVSEIQELLSLLEPETSASPNSGSDLLECSVNEKKRKRMESNRDSARRSRLRKKSHLENLTNEVNRLKFENKELKNRMGLVTYHCHLTWKENFRLRSESLALWAKLSDISRVSFPMQYNNNNNNNR